MKLSKRENLYAFEEKLSKKVHWHPNTISTLKLFAILPIIYYLISLSHFSLFQQSIAVLCFLLFGFLDYMDGIVARYSDRESVVGLIYDRLTDYPLLITLGIVAYHTLPINLLIAKVVLDVILLSLHLFRKKYTFNRARTAVHYLTLFILLLISMSIAKKPQFIELATALLILNIALTSIIILVHLKVLKKKYIADLLSISNLICGGYVIYMAYLGYMHLALLFLIIGALFDGLDGLAARKYGGTRFGVYSDDIADGFTYGIAPAVALVLHSMSANPDIFVDITIIASLYAVFTISRLVYFTLNKAQSDPNYFQGVPSTLGGIVVISGCYLFNDHLLLIVLFVGIACMLMLGFDTQYRHLGRWFGQQPHLSRLAVPVGVILLAVIVTGHEFYVISAIFTFSIIYGFTPVFLHFKHLVKKSV